MDATVAIRTLEATYKSSANVVAIETMILKHTQKVNYNCKTQNQAVEDNSA